MRQIRQEINIEQQQKLFLTTELRQAISLLQLTGLELNEYILNKIAENPFLEEELKSKTTAENYNEQWTTPNLLDLVEHFQEDYFSDWKEEKEENKEQRNYEHYLTERPSLYEHLECQLHLEAKNTTDLLIGKYLIGNLDTNGYLRVTLHEVARQLNVPYAQVERTLKLIQTFHPPGVGARTLQECLSLQLDQTARNNPLAKIILHNFFPELAAKKFSRIALALSVPIREVQEVYDLIRSLNPKPGQQFGKDSNNFIWPDATVVKDQGKYIVIVNDYECARLRINYNYVNEMRKAAGESEDLKRFLEDKLQSALGLIRGIEQRRLNIYKVFQCIVDVQSDFLDKGIAYLKPLTMNQVAELVNIHESTVSRVVANKYMQTPRGLFAVKYFFNSGVDSLNRDKVCSKSIKYLIAEIIKQEDPSNPLRDQDLVEILKQKGINISRRTVNKYRQSLGIPSHLLRRRY
ncbi:MAG TPA: RNA polymerase factor sigma-54 [Peptococcaceae bacterium]|nr:RNA polymerase factor sigma-54 [Peptococcaceae bacterium]